MPLDIIREDDDDKRDDHIADRLSQLLTNILGILNYSTVMTISNIIYKI